MLCIGYMNKLITLITKYEAKNYMITNKINSNRNIRI